MNPCRAHQRRCANSFAATGQYDFDIWRLSVISSSQHVQSTRRWPLDAYFPQFQEQWKQNTQEIRLATNEAGAGSSRGWDAVFGLYRQEVDLSRGYQFDMAMPSLFRIVNSDSASRTESVASYGDVTWHLTSRLDLTTGLRFTHDRARTSFRGDQMGATFQGQNSASQNTWLGHIAAGYPFSPEWRGNDVPMAPKYGLTVSAKGNLLVGSTTLRPQLTVRRTGSHYFDTANTLRQDAYTVIDAALAWSPTRNLDLALFVHNLADKAYRTYGFSYGPTGNFAQVAPERTVGMTATYVY